MTDFSPRDLLQRIRAVPGAGWTLLGAGLVLLLALFFVLSRPSPGHVPVVEMQDARVAALIARLDAAEARLLRAEAPRPDTLGARLDATEAAISARMTTADAALTARLDAAQEALAARLSAAEAALAPLATLAAANTRQTQALEAQAGRLTATEAPLAALTAGAARQAQAIEALTSRLAATEAPLAALATATTRQAQGLEALTSRIDRLAERQDAATTRAAQAESDQARRFDGLLGEAQAAAERRAAALEQGMRQALATLDAAAAQRFAAVEARTRALGAQEALRAALDGGRPLGAILAGLPNPAAALARFATAPAPTEAQLRAGFEEAARAARAAAQAAPRGGIAESALNRLGGMVTLRRGEEVVWGDPGEGEIERARRALAAGDLAMAIDRLGRLSPPARAAMEGWVAEAQGVLDARAALLALAAG